ncbi:MAG TPA: C25 family cysteine peptidase [Candidatus Hydrogenedentes bacterium]|nr:C25 family cysteine peptidase [Candidatus Hydrogenedentota bacterium]
MRCLSRVLVCAFPILCAALLSGCPNLPPAHFSVEPEAVEIIIGGDVSLSVTSDDSEDTSVLCVSSNPRVVRGDSTAKAYGLGLGTAKLTVKGTHSGESVTIDVTVVAPPDFNMSLPADPALCEPTLECTAAMSSVNCTLNFSGIAAEIVAYQQTLYHRLLLMGAERIQTPGMPELPVYTLHVAIPVDIKTGKRAAWNITVTPELEQTISGILVYPAQPAPWLEDSEELKEEQTRPEFVYDKIVYGSSDPFPEWTYQEEASQVGNLHVLSIRVSPIRFVPKARELVLARRLRVDVSFSGIPSPMLPGVLGDFTAIQAPGAEEWLANEMLNREMIPVITADDLSRSLASMDRVLVHDEAFELLIITRPDLYSEARRLALHRQDTGTRTYLASLDDDDYPDAESIREFVIALDESNRLPLYVAPGPAAMSAILLFGDAELIPPHQGMNVRGAPDPTGLLDYVVTVGTDLPYAAIRGDDQQPDVAIGRISVDTPDEAGAVVDKILRYEQRPAAEIPGYAETYSYFDDVVWPAAILFSRLELEQGSTTVFGSGVGFTGMVLPGDYLQVLTSGLPDPPWMEVASVISDTELALVNPYDRPPNSEGDYGIIGQRDGQDDWEFFVGAERVREFLSDRGVTVRFGYTRSGGPQPVADFYGDPLAPDLAAYGWNAAAADIQANWSEGVEGIIVHTDHGHIFGWGHPAFRAGDPESENPGDIIPMVDPETAWYPIVFSMNCDSGWFDNETDKVRFGFGLTEIPQTGPNAECFCERTLRYPGGGAVALVGACRGGDADANDRLLDGLFAALYPDYAEGSISPWKVRPEFDRLGAAFRWAMFHQRHWLGTDVVRADYNEQIYHLHGDPMLMMRLPGS